MPQRWRLGGVSFIGHVFNTLSRYASKGVASLGGLLRETLLSLVVCSLATPSFVGILILDLRIGCSHRPSLLHHFINVFQALLDLLLLTGEEIPDVRVLPHLLLKRRLIIVPHQHGSLVLVGRLEEEDLEVRLPPRIGKDWHPDSTVTLYFIYSQHFYLVNS